MPRSSSHHRSVNSRRLRSTTCITTMLAGISALAPAAANAQLLTLNGLSTDLLALTGTVTDQGAKITATTNLANTLNSSLNTLTSTVNSQVTALQNATTSNATNLATVTATVNDQRALLTANTDALTTVTSGLGAVTSGLGTLTSTVGQQAATLGNLQTSLGVTVGNLADVSATVNQQGAQITANLGVLDALRSGVSTLSGTVTGQGGAIQTLQSTLATAQGDVGALTGTVNTLSGTVGTLGTAVAGQDGAIRALRDTVATAQGDVGALTNTVGTIATDLAATATQVVRANSDIGALRADVSANVADIAGLRATIGSTGSDVGDLLAQVSDHEVRITANTAGLGTLGATVATQGGDLATAAANIASLQGLVTVQGGTLTALGADVAVHDARITANADAILSLRNMAVSGNASPVQYTTPAAPLVATTGATNDVAIMGAQAGPVRVHNVAAGQVTAGSTDAVNGGQLFDMGQQVGALDAVAVRYEDATRARISLGAQGAPVTIGNVAAGRVATGSTDAVNGGQLADTNAAVAAVRDDLGTLGTSVSAQGMLLGANADAIAVLRRDTQNGAIGPVRYADPSAPLVPNGGSTTNHLVLVGRDPAPVMLHNVADGTVASGSTDAVNGGQLFALASSYQGLADLAVRYDDADRNAATLGRAGTPVTLRNLAAGTLAAQSSEAATAGQLYDTNLRLGTLGAQLTDTIGDLGDDLDRLRDAVDTGARGPMRYADAATPTVPNAGTVSQDLTLVGAANGAVRLHNVAAGVIASTSTDAVNGAQLFSLGNAAAGMFGNGVAYDPLTGFAGNFTFQGAQHGSIQSVFGAIEQSLAQATAPVVGGGGTGVAPTTLRYFKANSSMADSAALGFDSTAIGPASTSMGVAAIAVGRNAMAGGDSSVAIGDGAMAMDGKAVSIGLGNVASGNGAVAIGDPNYATGEGATALGKDNNATGTGAIALGNVNVAQGDGSTAIGSLNTADGMGAAALGYTNTAQGTGAIAIGANNAAVGNGALAIGANVTTSADETLAIGSNTRATGLRAVAIGNAADASREMSSAFGYGAQAQSDYAAAIGTASRATGYGATAIGTVSSASGFAATALGSGAIADHEGSVALGSAAQTTRGAVAAYTAFGVAGTQASQGEIAVARNIAYPDPVSGNPTPVGNRQITGVAAGAQASDAVNVAQLRGVSGTLGAAFVAGFGGGASYDGATGALGTPRYTLNGVTYSSVGDALEAISSRIGSTTGTTTPSAPPMSTETETRIVAVETRVTTVEAKAEQAVAYDDAAKTSVTLGAGGQAVALRNVAPGVAATDAVNVGQMSNALAGAVAEANGYTDRRVAALSFDLSRVNRDAHAGIAGALAMAGMPQAYEEGKSMVAMGVGTFQGQSAVAMGVSRVMNDGRTVVKLGATYDSRKRVAANAGVGFQF
ncbi:YadA-like family protein [Sphingomonas adhaesiva]|uniref:YadA-like family protein n=1 Tax=Sphingomonas adhaesiva TaxID=28212 RepID=UPI002FF64E2B